MKISIALTTLLLGITTATPFVNIIVREDTQADCVTGECKPNRDTCCYGICSFVCSSFVNPILLLIAD
jgi:hypothetical protein